MLATILELGSGDGAVVRALASHKYGLGSLDSWTRRHMWVEFAVSSYLCSEGIFFGSSGSSSLLKNQHFQILIRSGIRGPQVYQLKTATFR